LFVLFLYIIFDGGHGKEHGLENSVASANFSDAHSNGSSVCVVFVTEGEKLL